MGIRKPQETKIRHITIEGVPLEYVQRNVKRIRLVVYASTGVVHLIAPLKTVDEKAFEFAASKLEWIKKHRQRILARSNPEELLYSDGETHYFQGMRYVLKIKEVPGRGFVRTAGDDVMEMGLRPGTSKEKRQKALERFYRRELEKAAAEVAVKWEKKTGVKAGGITVRKMKSRWGSYRIRDRMITLNLELAKKPPECLEYVVVHELLHYYTRFHDAGFKSRLGKLLPGWKRLKEKLNSFPAGHMDWEC